MIIEKISSSEEETALIAQALARESESGDVYALIGELGCGKTFFSREFARALGVADDVTSPTFALMEEYEGRIKLYHFDLYRIENESEFDMLGFEEFWEGDGVSLIEWAERAESLLPATTIHIRFEYIDETSRRITIEYPDS